jgi:hypothetical protein|tara:strand:- start:6444 stop:6581 length:138 start_codon:yes stop_codon:yes gene_type:complete
MAPAQIAPELFFYTYKIRARLACCARFSTAKAERAIARDHMSPGT